MSAKPLDVHGPFGLDFSKFHVDPSVLDALEGADDFDAAPKLRPTRSSPGGPGALKTIGGRLGAVLKREPAADGPSIKIDPGVIGKLFPQQWDADPSLGGLDPQIAASTTHVIVTTSGRIAFYDKTAKLVTTKKDGSPLPNPVASSNFFAPLKTSLTSALNLPSGVDPTVFGLNMYYDTRVIFDSYRKRFWLVSFTINKGTKTEGVANTTAQKGARRTKCLLAVSNTEDPRDGFLMYWWDAVQDDGKCHDPAGCAGIDFLPGDAGDYPTLGISETYFIQTNSVGHRDPTATDWDAYANSVTDRYARVCFLDATKLSQGNAADGWAFTNLKKPDGKVATGNIQPAVHHGPVPSGLSFLASKFGSGLLVWAFTASQSGPTGPVQALVPVKAFTAPVNALQKKAPDVPNPNPIKFTNLGNAIMKAAFNKGKLYVAAQDAKVWQGASGPVTSIRFIRVDVSKILQGTVPTDKASGFVDRIFGKASPEDPAGAISYYGMPAVEVTNNGDAVLAYIRSGTSVYPEVRCSLYYATESDIRPSKLIRKSDFPLFSSGAEPGDPIGQIDTGAAGVDPNGKDIWIAEPFAFRPDTTKTAAGWRLVVARVRP
jgi:hypothetical protein